MVALFKVCSVISKISGLSFNVYLKHNTYLKILYFLFLIQLYKGIRIFPKCKFNNFGKKKFD